MTLTYMRFNLLMVIRGISCAEKEFLRKKITVISPAQYIKINMWYFQYLKISLLIAKFLANIMKVFFLKHHTRWNWFFFLITTLINKQFKVLSIKINVHSIYMRVKIFEVNRQFLISNFFFCFIDSLYSVNI